MYKCLLSVVLILISFTSFGATLTGTVKDSTDNSPLIGVIVNIKNTSFVAQTDPDGKYEIKGVPNGKFEVVFSFITYEKRTLPVTIKGGQDVVLDAIMAPEGSKQQLNAVTVTATRNTHTETAVLQEIKNSNTVVSGIGSAQISKTMDRNAADVVKRVPGVTIQDDRFIVVRGLADRYNTVWLNDAGAPSSETDKKAFSFDIIPSGLIDRILIFKTPAAELPGDFAGGMVKVYTTSLVDRNQITVGFQTSSREYTTGRKFDYNNPGSKTDWLGFDGGARELPSAVPDTIFNKNNKNIDAITKSFKNEGWQIKTKSASPDFRLGLSVSNAFNLNKVRIGNTLGLAYSNTNTNYRWHRMQWEGLVESYNYNDNSYANTASAGIMDNLGVAVGNSKIEFKTLYSQIGKASVTERSNIRDTASQNQGVDERSYKLEYESRATYTTQLLGTHTSNDNKRKYTWSLGYTDLFKNMPDTRRIKYTKQWEQPDSLYYAQISSTVDPFNGGARLFSQLYEHVYSFNQHFSQKFDINNKASIELHAGSYAEYKSRLYFLRQIGETVIKNATTFNYLYYPIDRIFADSNLGTGKFRMEETTDGWDKYTAKNTLVAGFMSANVSLFDKLNIIGGVRYEYNKQDINTVVSVDTIHPVITTKFLLPSANVSYNFTDKMLVRAAYGKSLNRPEFREMAPAPWYNFDDREFIYGSLYPSPIALHGDTLNVAKIDNYDVRWEWYPSVGEMVQVGFFYKSFKDPIQKVIAGSDGSGSKNMTYINGTSAYCEGVEIDVRKNLGFADDLFQTDVFKDISLVGNLALTKSEIYFDTAAINARLQTATDLYKKYTLQGQSPYVVNAGLYYQNDKNGFQGSILYNVFAKRIYAIGRTDLGDETIFEMPFKSFDATISKTFFKHYVLTFGAQNIFNSKVLFMKDLNNDGKLDVVNDRELKSYKPGTYYTVGVKVKF